MLQPTEVTWAANWRPHAIIGTELSLRPQEVLVNKQILPAKIPTKATDPDIEDELEMDMDGGQGVRGAAPGGMVSSDMAGGGD